MAGSGSPQPNRPNPPRRAAQAPSKPLQVMHISRKEEKNPLGEDERNSKADSGEKKSAVNSRPNDPIVNTSARSDGMVAKSPKRTGDLNRKSTLKEFPEENIESLTMADLLESEQQFNQITSNPQFTTKDQYQRKTSSARSVDDFDFDEDAFLAALAENEPIGTTGETVKGSVIGIDGDGVYVDIGGKAPGFMPKPECGLGVITDFKERFPKGLEVEVLVTREQNADGMVTISCRALALRKSWEKVQQMEKEGLVAQVKVNGFNRGGVTCDLEGLRGFIPRSQLENGENHEALVGKTLGVAFLEVNPDTRKLVLSEKRAAVAARFAQLEIGQLVEGQVAAVKPYGFFIDLGGVSGLLHQSMITNGSLRSLREVFNQGDRVKALITELDPGRGRIGLNTALLEGPPGELLIEKDKVMEEASERAIKARSILKPKDDPSEEELSK